jgi:hypothetical protein
MRPKIASIVASQLRRDAIVNMASLAERLGSRLSQTITAARLTITARNCQRPLHAMSASPGSSTTDVDVGPENEAPQLSALFLIRFDKKVGYVILEPE